VSCLTYIITELSGTGLLELENFHYAARRFQDKVADAVYDKYVTKQYGGTGGNTWSSTSSTPDFDPQKAQVPHMSDYRHVTLAQALKAVWPDILLLALYAVLFFAAAFVSFLKYDVR